MLWLRDGYNVYRRKSQSHRDVAKGYIYERKELNNSCCLAAMSDWLKEYIQRKTILFWLRSVTHHFGVSWGSVVTRC